MALWTHPPDSSVELRQGLLSTVSVLGLVKVKFSDSRQGGGWDGTPPSLPEPSSHSPICLGYFTSSHRGGFSI